MVRRHTLRVLGAALGASAVLVAGCSSGDAEGEVVRMWIEPELVPCEGVAPMECMEVSYTEDGAPQLFYDQIEGFTFNEGTAYVIDVQVTEVPDPPADASSLSYSLVEVVSEDPQ
jgi:hypothetical protein